MFRVTNIPPGAEQATRVWTTVRAQPNWIVRACLMVFTIVIALPILALFLLAIGAAMFVFGMLWCVNKVTSVFTGGKRKDIEGRENVRVIRRD